MCNICSLFNVLNNAVASWPRWNLGLFHDCLAFHLVSCYFHRLGSWPDEYYAILFAHFWKVLVLGKKTIAGMDCIGARCFGSLDDLGHVEIALSGLGWANVVGLIGSLDVHSTCVFVRIDRY